jgi:hypothetical protein
LVIKVLDEGSLKLSAGGPIAWSDIPVLVHKSVSGRPVMRIFSERSHTAWQRSSFCQNGECAEVAERSGEFLLRSSRSPKDIVRLTPAEWQALVNGIQAGEFPEPR